MKFANPFLLVPILFVACASGRTVIPECPAPSVGVHVEVDGMSQEGAKYSNTLLWISEIVRYCDAIDGGG